MKLLIVSTAPFIYNKKEVYAYSPYVNELLVWNKNATSITFCCPIWESDRALLVSKIPFEINKHYPLMELNGLSFKGKIQSFFRVFNISIILFKAMQQADHIHLRSPGNIGLLGCLVQILFPSKPKTAKYAGNWDFKAKQPWTYRLQKWILNNPFLSRNMQVLVYGEWPNQSRNIKSFFTATYSEAEKQATVKTINNETKIKLLFVGSLVAGKNPLYAIQLVEQLLKSNQNVALDLYGEGILREDLEKYIEVNNLSQFVVLQGNQNQEVLKKAYQESHFIILPSKSEGWPKAIAEGMFWGCVPLATAVSCVPNMLDHGNRGILLEMDINKDVAAINNLIRNPTDYKNKSKAAINWSRKYTTDFFEQEIKKLLNESLYKN